MKKKKKIIILKNLEDKIYEEQNYRDQELIYNDNPYLDVPDNENKISFPDKVNSEYEQ